MLLNMCNSFYFILLLGTGKTRVLVEAIAEIMYIENKETTVKPRIMVCSPSSSSVIEIASRLLKKFAQNSPDSVKGFYSFQFYPT